MAAEKQQNLQDVFPQPCPQEQDSRHRFPDQRRQAAGRDQLVRQFLPVAAARWACAAGLQACGLDGDAVGGGPALRSAAPTRRRAKRPRSEAEAAIGNDTTDQHGADRQRALVVHPYQSGRAARVARRCGWTRRWAWPRAIDLDVVAAEVAPLRERPPRDPVRRRPDRRAEGQRRGDGGRPRRRRRHALADPAAQSRARLECKVIDRTGLILEIFGERARTREGVPAGRAGGADLSALAAGPLLDPPRAAAWRRRLHGRPGRAADRARPPPHRRPDHRAQARARSRSGAPAACTARPASACPIR